VTTEQFFSGKEVNW